MPKLGIVVIGGFVAVAVFAATGSLILRDGEIEFPDGTLQTTAAQPSLRIVDSGGQFIGPVVGSHNGGRMSTYLKLGDSQEPVFFDVWSDRFELIHSGFLFFSGTDCTGGIYIGDFPGNSDFFSHLYFAFGPSGSLFKSDPNQNAPVEPQSWWTGFQSWTVGDTSDYCSNTLPSPSPHVYYSAEQIADLSTLPFVPDFRLE